MNPELTVQQSVPGVTCNEVYQLKWLDDVFPSHFWYLVSYDSVCFLIFWLNDSLIYQGLDEQSNFWHKTNEIEEFAPW